MNRYCCLSVSAAPVIAYSDIYWNATMAIILYMRREIYRVSGGSGRRSEGEVLEIEVIGDSLFPRGGVGHKIVFGYHRNDIRVQYPPPLQRLRNFFLFLYFLFPTIAICENISSACFTIYSTGIRTANALWIEEGIRYGEEKKKSGAIPLPLLPFRPMRASSPDTRRGNFMLPQCAHVRKHGQR